MDNKNMPAETLLSNLQKALNDFRKGGDIMDDMSLIYLKRL